MKYEKSLSNVQMQWELEPTPNPSEEGSFTFRDRSEFPSWEGCMGGRVRGRNF